MSFIPWDPKTPARVSAVSRTVSCFQTCVASRIKCFAQLQLWWSVFLGRRLNPQGPWATVKVFLAVLWAGIDSTFTGIGERGQDQGPALTHSRGVTCRVCSVGPGPGPRTPGEVTPLLSDARCRIKTRNQQRVC